MMKEMEFDLQNTYVQLPKEFYSIVKPERNFNSRLVLLNKELASDLDLNIDYLESEQGINILSGQKLISNTTLASAYAGHQFGHFTMLGDGRAILLGEHTTNNKKIFDIQLKGSGVTPYSRRGDGKAVLGPMLREYLISKGMFNLGIPTTRSLAVLETGEKIRRESMQKGAILVRVAKSHLRVGTFEYARKFTDIDKLKKLADYAIDRHYNELNNNETKYLDFLKIVMKRQAKLIAKWQLVGFVHGVMNTDNMTISGETIDYGPCAFLDAYQPQKTFSSIDRFGRYAYKNQPKIANWNISKFAESLLPLLSKDPTEIINLANKTISRFNDIYQEEFYQGMYKKLGIVDNAIGDRGLVDELLEVMGTNQADYTNTFVDLTYRLLNKSELADKDDFVKWHKKWINRLLEGKFSQEASFKLMQSANPVVIPRNYYVEKAIEAAIEDNDYSLLNEFLEVLKNPYKADLDSKFTQVDKSFQKTYITFCGN